MILQGYVLLLWFVRTISRSRLACTLKESMVGLSAQLRDSNVMPILLVPLPLLCRQDAELMKLVRLFATSKFIRLLLFSPQDVTTNLKFDQFTQG